MVVAKVGKSLEMLTKEDVERLEKIAVMVLHEISDSEIADAFGIDPATLQNIKGTPAFSTVFTKLHTERIETIQLMDKGWDSVEQLALSTVVDHLTVSRDAKYALMAAKLANAASRRGEMSKYIKPQNGSKLVLNLQQTFIARIENGMRAVIKHDKQLQNGGQDTRAPPETTDAEITEESLPQKHNDFLSISQAEKLLNPGNSVAGVQFETEGLAKEVEGLAEKIMNGRKLVGGA